MFRGFRLNNKQKTLSFHSRQIPNHRHNPCYLCFIQHHWVSFVGRNRHNPRCLYLLRPLPLYGRYQVTDIILFAFVLSETFMWESEAPELYIKLKRKKSPKDICFDSWNNLFFFNVHTLDNYLTQDPGEIPAALCEVMNWLINWFQKRKAIAMNVSVQSL